MIKVMVRHILDEEGYFFGEFSPHEIEEVEKAFKARDISINTGENIIEGEYSCSQFVVSQSDRYLEIIVDDIS